MNKKKLKVLSLGFALTVLLSGCGAGSVEKSIEMDSCAQAESLMYNDSDSMYTSGNDSVPVIKNAEDKNKFMTYQYSIQIETAKVKESYETIMNKVNEFNGILVDSSLAFDSETDYSDSYIKCKVPHKEADKFLEFLASKDLGSLVSKRQSAVNLTPDHTDLKGQLDLNKELIAKYQEMLDNATDTNDMIELTRSISNLLNNNKNIEYRLQQIKENVSYDDYYIQLRPKFNTLSGMKELPFGVRLSTAFGDSFKIAKTIIQGVILFIIRYWFIWLLIFGIVKLILFIIKKRKRKKNNQEIKE